MSDTLLNLMILGVILTLVFIAMCSATSKQRYSVKFCIVTFCLILCWGLTEGLQSQCKNTSTYSRCPK